MVKWISGGYKMNIQNVKLVCFSPTGTTRKVIESMARGMKADNVELIDITRPSIRKTSLQTLDNELLIVAVPVYMGRVPGVLSDWLHAIKARNTPTVCIVVYGNRAYENALLELKDILTERGCQPIAGAAFIGEHSFSSTEFPSSVGRPDSNDLLCAEKFGCEIRNLMKMVPSVSQLGELKIPGSKPYGGVTDLWHIDFIAVDNRCIQCGICAEVCPVGAINPADSSVIAIDKCTLCCACIKKCPQNARSMKPGMMKDAAIRCTKFVERKEPEYFINVLQ
jgi:ferredoxin/menaquinone-dependent protoporphyrinogen IX oxidase